MTAKLNQDFDHCKLKAVNPFFQGFGNRGFTLIEIMVAILLIVIALLGITSTTFTIMKGNAFSKTMTTATTLAQDKMENLTNTSYATLTSGSETVNFDASSYTRSWTITNAPAEMKTIAVTVTWSWQGTHAVTLTKLVGDHV